MIGPSGSPNAGGPAAPALRRDLEPGAAVRCEELSIRYRQRRDTLGPWNLRLAEGEASMLCGPSGSGKTGLLHLLAGLPAGAFGPSVAAGRLRSTRPVGLLLEKLLLQLLGPTAREELDGAEARSLLSPVRRRQERAWLLEAFSLGPLQDRPVREISEGEKQRLALACRLLHAPPLLLLDHPAASLDPDGRAALATALLRATRRGTAVLFADADGETLLPIEGRRFPLTAPEPFPEPGARTARPRRAEGPSPGWAWLELREMQVRRGGRTVLEEVSGRVAPGEVVALAGPNGSEKTSLLLAVAGLLRTPRGSRAWGGPRRRRPRTAFLLQESLWQMSGGPVGKDLERASRAGGARGGVSREDLAACLGLETLAGRPGVTLSRGEMQRAALGMALSARADVVCLDEPFRYLPGPERERITRCLRGLRQRGVALLVADHTGEIESCADQVWRIHRGRMTPCGSHLATSGT